MAWTLLVSFIITCTFSVAFIQASQYKVTDRVYFDISTGGEDLGRIVIGLFGEIAPKTVKNFLQIASVGIDKKTYAGTTFHRVIERFMIQGGSILDDDGIEILSVYDNAYFEDENFIVKHTAPGFVSMANAGPNTNGCQFFITTIAAPWLDGTHVAFGKVLQGQNIVHKIEHSKTDVNDRPLVDVIVRNCGTIPTPNSFDVSDSDVDLMAWLKASIVPLTFSFSVLAFFHWVMRQL